MSQSLPPNTLMVTFLADALSKRGLTTQHLADLLSPVPEATIRSWVEGVTAPTATDIMPLARALDVSAVELTAGWLVNRYPSLERAIRHDLLDELESGFPRSTDYALIAPRKKPGMTVIDPRDEHESRRMRQVSQPGRLRKRASGAEKSSKPPRH